MSSRVRQMYESVGSYKPALIAGLSYEAFRGEYVKAWQRARRTLSLYHRSATTRDVLTETSYRLQKDLQARARHMARSIA